jgi:hypothetical protein
VQFGVPIVVGRGNVICISIRSLQLNPHWRDQIQANKGVRVSSSVGRRVWVIPEGYIPAGSHGPAPQMVSHEAVCILSAAEDEAEVNFTVFFEDRAPIGPYVVRVPGRRTKHLRFNNFEAPEPIPKDTDFSSVIESDQPIVVQHTRLDSRQDANALMTTIAFPGSDS